MLALKLRSFRVSPSQRFKQVAKGAYSHILGMGLVPKKWVRAVRVALHLWGQDSFEKVRDPCGGRMAMDKEQNPSRYFAMG